MIIPSERISVPSLMQRPPMGRGRYMGPPSLEPGYGGFAYQGQYFPGDFDINLISLKCLIFWSPTLL